VIAIKVQVVEGSTLSQINLAINQKERAMIEEKVIAENITTPTMTAEQLEQLWADHLDGEFAAKDVDDNYAKHTIRRQIRKGQK